MPRTIRRFKDREYERCDLRSLERSRRRGDFSQLEQLNRGGGAKHLVQPTAWEVFYAASNGWQTGKVKTKPQIYQKRIESLAMLH